MDNRRINLRLLTTAQNSRNVNKQFQSIFLSNRTVDCGDIFQDY